MYQLPIFCQQPKFVKPILYEGLSTLERIPCSTLMIRVEKAPTDSKGRSRSITNVPESIRVDQGFIKQPPAYTEGKYNNQYVELFTEEMKIYEEKAHRIDPTINDCLPRLRKGKEGDKKLAKKIKKRIRKKYDEIDKLEFLNMVLDEPIDTDIDHINLNFFSQYIPEIGFRFSVDLLFNCDPGLVYVAICSINPPGSLYQEDSTYEKIIVYNEVNFESHVKAQKFLETFYAFVNVPIEEKAHMIIDIKAVKFKKNKPTEVHDYAWTIYPMFTTMEIDEIDATTEVFIRSGIFMIPLFQGKVRNDMIGELAQQNDCWNFLQDQTRKKLAPVSILPNAGVVVRCVDNQREGHFKKLADWERIDYTFCPKNRSKYEYNNKTISSYEKGKRIEYLIPKDTAVEDAQEEINALIANTYGVEI